MDPHPSAPAPDAFGVNQASLAGIAGTSTSYTPHGPGRRGDMVRHPPPDPRPCTAEFIPVRGGDTAIQCAVAMLVSLAERRRHRTLPSQEPRL